MKRNDWFIILSTLIYSFLFFKESAGVNVLIFDVVLVGMFAFRDENIVKERSWLLSVVTLLVAGSAVALRGNSLAFLAHLAAFLLFAARSNKSGRSVIIQIAHQVYAEVVGLIQFIADLDRYFAVKKGGDPKRRFRTLFLIALPLVIGLVFVGLYRQSNPLFKEWTDQIDLSFISIHWISFTLIGFFLMYPVFRGILIKSLDRWESTRELKLVLENSKTEPDKWMSPRTEFLAGALSLATLNFVILFMIGSDVAHLFFGVDYPQDLTRTDLVHNGVGTLIVSIVLAIIITVFFFRGRLNFVRETPKLKMLANVWLMLNVILVALTVQKNNLYVEDFGLTYKRIGVYVWLTLTLIGLVYTLIKVNQVKTNWYLIRYTGTAFFVVLVGASVVNWDKHIAEYNLELAERKGEEPELDYLLDLGPDAIPVIIEHADSIPYDSWRKSDGVHRLAEKVHDYEKRREGLSWKSWTLSDHKIHQTLAQVDGPLRALFPAR